MIFMESTDSRRDLLNYTWATYLVVNCVVHCTQYISVSNQPVHDQLNHWIRLKLRLCSAFISLISENILSYWWMHGAFVH